MLTVKNVKGFFWSYRSYQSLYVGASKRADVIPIEPFETCYFCVFGNSWQDFKEMVTDTEMTATESRIKLQATRASLSLSQELERKSTQIQKSSGKSFLYLILF